VFDDSFLNPSPNCKVNSELNLNTIWYLGWFHLLFAKPCLVCSETKKSDRNPSALKTLF